MCVERHVQVGASVICSFTLLAEYIRLISELRARSVFIFCSCFPVTLLNGPPTPSANDGRRYLVKSATLFCSANVAKGVATSREQVFSIQYVVNGFAKI